MRTFGTIFFGFIFIFAFFGFFLVHSVVGYPLSTPDVIDTAKEADLYGAFMAGFDLAMQEAVKNSNKPEFQEEIASGLKEALEDAVPEDWFYETLEKAYAGFVAFVEGGDDVAEIDLKDQKAKLQEYFDSLIEKYGTGGEDEARVREQLAEALDVVPDTVTIGDLLAKAGGDAPSDQDLDEVRGKIGEFKKAQMGGLGTVLALFVILCLLAMKTPKRFMISIGLILTLSGGFYLAVTNIGTDLLWDEVVKGMDTKTLSGEAEKFGQEKAMIIVEAGVRAAIGRSDTMVLIIMVLGLLLFLGGFFVRGAPPVDPGPSGRELYGAGSV